MTSAEFLVLQAFLIVIGIVIVRRMARAPLPTGELPKVPEHPDPYATAWLVGGDGGVVRLATFDLVRHGYAQVGDDQHVRPQVPPQDAPPIDPLARSVYQSLNGAVKVEEHYFTRQERNQPLQAALAGYRERWIALGMAAAPEVIRRSWKLLGGLAGAFVLLAAVRIVEAVSHGRHNIGFIVVLTIIGVAAALILVPVRRLTPRGKAFLERMSNAHDLNRRNTASWSRRDQRGAAGDAMLLGVAVLGFGALADTPWNRMRETFRRSESGGGGCGTSSSCGSGSSCGSSDGGGSGCGGGGCGGGGD